MRNQFLNVQRNNPALAGIDFQQNTHLFDALTEAFEELRKTKASDTKSIQAIGIPGIVKAHTNMTTTFDMRPDVGYGAYMEMPAITLNHPFFAKWVGNGTMHREGVQLLTALGGAATGGVDLARARVTGVYADIPINISFGEALVRDKRFSARELAGIHLHEQGHGMSYFHELRTTVTSSVVISAAAKALYDIDDPKTRVDTLKLAAEILGVDVYNPETIANTTKAQRMDTVQTILLTSYAYKLRSESGNNLYEIRNAEQLADQYATRMGAGVDLVTGLDKINRLYGDAALMSTPTFILLEAAKLLWFIIMAIGLPYIVIPMAILMPAGNVAGQYDESKARFTFIRRQLNDALKIKDLPDEMKKSIVDDIKLIETVEKEYNERRTLFELVKTTMGNFSKRGYNQKEAQKQLEALLNNDLFAKAAEFSLMK